MAAGTETEVVHSEGFTLAEMVGALKAAGADFVGLLRSLDEADGQQPVPNMTWTVSETAAHMLNIVRRGLGDRRRAESIEGLAVLNDESIAEITERDPGEVARLIEEDMSTYATLLEATTQETATEMAVRLHAGLRTDVPTALSYQLFDFLGHGLDIARATDRPWSIRPEHAMLVLQAGLPALGPWLRDEVREGPQRTIVFAFPGSTWSLVATAGQGRYTVRPADRALARAEVDPVDTFLAIAGRLDPSDSVVADLASWYRPI